MTQLAHLIRSEIETTGPMAVSRYMELCLSHPVHGYYRQRDPLGTAGDFTTAPEISQLFGELVGAWLMHMWCALAQPVPIALIELGPGRGTLMADIVRTLRHDPALAEQVEIHLIETSPALRAAQSATLAKLDVVPVHHDDLTSLPDGPALWIANEFFDALPTDQFVVAETGWHARKIALGADGRFTFGVDPAPTASRKALKNTGTGAVVEHSPAQDHALAVIAAHLQRHGGAGLIIDYGTLTSGLGDTLQAVKDHAYTGVFTTPGEADLTTHVDFEHLTRLAAGLGVSAVGLAEQGAFLLALGLLERAGQLGANTSHDQQEAIRTAAERLAGDQAMGKLFKVMGFASRDLPLPGLHQPSFILANRSQDATP